MLVKAAMPGHFSMVVFALTLIALDLEVLWRMVRLDYPFHTFWHTYLGATIIAAVFTVLGKPAGQLIKTAWNRIAAKRRAADLAVSVPIPWVASFTGSFVGAYSHILLDSLFHSDMEPLQPWSAANPLFGIVNPMMLQILCVVCGVLGLAWFHDRAMKTGEANNTHDGIRRPADGSPKPSV